MNIRCRCLLRRWPFWKCLIEALKYDKCEWPEDVPKDTSSPDFAYCYSGERWFVNVSSYFHSRNVVVGYIRESLSIINS
ncbi:YqcI/YcgG family protein [Brenneria izadpanahii]|uniref:YqcI/YcgG family protein n=1 Tax=Brenneria izadpanahii TaxID=2722756 RepID=A0ABX7UXI1_9GAMM|nr:YqcI/YcgG family protein [Brenneria izadpanahii]